MPEGGNRVATTGSLAGVGSVSAKIVDIQHAVGKYVTLSANYVMAHPPGYPAPPGMTGTAAGNLYYPRTLSSGTRILLNGAEADAIVAAGGGSYS